MRIVKKLPPRRQESLITALRRVNAGRQRQQGKGHNLSPLKSWR